jgi:Dcp1-like decapping family
LATAAHVALYNFDVPTRRWTRKDVEGSLFLVKRRGSPRFQIVILNKKSAENYVEDVGGGFQCELNPPYLLYRNKVGEVVGIWFYEETDCKRMCDILSKISSTFAAPSDAEAGAKTNANDNGNNSTSAPTSQPASPAYAYSAAPVDGSYAVGEGGEDEDEGIFWDKKVEVPAEVGMPGGAAAGATTAISTGAAAEAPNALAGLLAGLKVASAPQQAQAVAQPSPSAMPLLTPQFLLNQQQQQQQQQQTRPAVAPVVENQGAKLLQSLRSSSSSAMPASPAAVARVDSSAAGKVSALLKSLAENEVFCKELAREMKQAGL